MALLNIVKEGDDTLRKVCRPVKDITPRILTLLDDMKETLADADGVGLAAPQVGVLRRIAVVVNEKNEMIELINPEVIGREGEQRELEGCLSVPNEWGITKRPMKVLVKAMNREGKTFTVGGEGLTARAFCHEIDHLDGKLFKDEAIRMLTEEEIKELIGD